MYKRQLSAFLAALTLAEDAETSSAASRALEPEPESGPGPHDRGMVPPTSGLPAVSENRIAKSGEGRILSGSLVSAVDAEGRATIAISTIREGIGRSAVFRCDVRGGVLRAMGRNEPEPTETGGLIHEAFLGLPSDCDALRDVPELALRLLGGILLMGPRSKANASVRAWIDEILGPGFRPQPIPIPAPSLRPDRDPHHRAEASLLADMPLHVRAVLDACPNWLDASALTVELAEEIELREGKDRLTDPARHAGAYRYLFEHRLIHRLDLYARMLLWMAWFWRFAEEPGLSDSAIAIAAELGDAQFAVPSHPFSRALTTRSLDAARLRIRERRR